MGKMKDNERVMEDRELAFDLKPLDKKAIKLTAFDIIVPIILFLVYYASSWVPVLRNLVEDILRLLN